MADVDLNTLIADAKAKLDAAKATADAAKAAAAKAGKGTDAANAIIRNANKRFQYAKTLEPQIKEYEFTINLMATKLGRGDKLTPDEQSQLNDAIKKYKATTGAYEKAYAEGNNLLTTVPTGAKATVKAETPASATGTTGATGTEGAAGAAGGTGVSVDQQNKDLDALLANARKQLVKMGDKERIALANALTAAGYTTPAIGAYNDTLLLQYQAALTAAKNYNTTNKDLITSGDLQPLDFTGFIAKQTVVQNQLKGITGAGGGGGSAGPTITQRISDPTQAASEIQNVFSTVLKREATDAEVKAITGILNDFEKKNPFSTIDGKTTGGLDRGQFLTDLLRKGVYSVNPKAAAGILGKLATEVATRKAGELEGKNLDSTQAILETARLNGVTVPPEQMKTYLEQIKGGKALTAIQQNIRNLAATGYPDNIKKLIAEGNDLLTVYSPYRQAMATELELNQNEIGLNDPSLQAAIGPQGESTLFDFKKSLRKDPRWQYTENARAEASDLVTTVLKNFGFMG